MLAINASGGKVKLDVMSAVKDEQAHDETYGQPLSLYA